MAVRLVGKLSLRQNTSVQRFLAVEGRGIGLAVKSAPAQNKPSRPKQIDPRINPNGVSNYDPMLMMRRGSTMSVSAAAEMGEILPKRTRN